MRSRAIAIPALVASALVASAASPDTTWWRERLPRRRILLAADGAGLGRASRRGLGPRPTTRGFRAAWDDDGLFLRFDAYGRGPRGTR